MKLKKTGYMHRPTETEWNEIIAGVPRLNFEKALFDTMYQSGVLSGLEVQQQAVPNLTVKLTAGRAVYRDTATGHGKVIEVLADQSVDLSGFLPAGSPSTVLIVASPLIAMSDPITPPNAEAGTEDYDAAYTPATFQSTEQDTFILQIVGAPSGQQVVLAAVTLNAGQTQILSSHISYGQRQDASSSAIVQALSRKITQLEGIVTPIGSFIPWLQPVGQIPANFLLADGRELSRSAYPELFAAYSVRFGAGDGVSTFKIPDLRNLFVVGAGDDYTLGQTGGADNVVLTTAQLPSHSHAATAAAAGGHAHAGSTASDGAHGHYITGSSYAPGNSGTDYWAPRMDRINADGENLAWAGGPEATDPNLVYRSTSGPSQPPSANAGNNFVVAAGSSHQHALSTAAAPDHTHALSVDAVGSGTPHENRPPFFAIYQIIRAR
jgi:microcystin-dependent protein